MIDTLTAFKKAYIYETFSGTETNVFSDENAPLLFQCIADAPTGGLLAGIRNLIHNWNAYLLKDDRADMQSIINLLTSSSDAPPSIFDDEKPDFEFIIDHDYKKDVFEKLRAIIKNNQEKNINCSDKLSLWQRAGRIIQKWKNITETTLQIVNADPALLEIISGSSGELVTSASTTIQFNGEYTMLSPSSTTDSSIRVFLPGANTTVAQYNQWRKEEKEAHQKPVELNQHQVELFPSISKGLTDRVCAVAAAETKVKSKHEARFATSAVALVKNTLYQSMCNPQEPHQDPNLSLQYLYK